MSRFFSFWLPFLQVRTATPVQIDVGEFENAFNRMARAAGVSEVSEVIERFRTQKQTFSVLEEQQTQAETDVREMGIKKEELDKEFVEVRSELY